MRKSFILKIVLATVQVQILPSVKYLRNFVFKISNCSDITDIVCLFDSRKVEQTLRKKMF